MVRPTFQNLYLLLQSSQGKQALALLEEASSLHPAERAYLRAYVLWQQNRWEELATCLVEVEAPGANLYRENTEGMTLRRRLAWICWLMGNLAMQVEKYDDAFSFFFHCIRYLDMRRMNDNVLRVRAFCGRGAALLHMHSAIAAVLAEYKHAARICQKKAVIEPPELALGLCEAYLAHNDLALAQSYGNKVLRLIIDPYQSCIVRLLLGKIARRQGENTTASAYFQEARTFVRQCEQPKQHVKLLLSFAQIEYSEGQIIAARVSCAQALMYEEQCPSAVRGDLYLLAGKLALEENLSEEALDYFSKALELFDGAKLAAAHRELAEMYEGAGQLEQAITHWKAAYQAMRGNDL